MKICPDCKQSDKVFVSNGYCRPCHYARTEHWRKANPDKSRKIIRTYNRKKRDRVVQLLGGRCKRCGETDWRCLQIDHVGGGGTKEHKKLGVARVNAKVLRLEGKGYQLLCANCNWRKRYENEEVRNYHPEEYVS